jgi:hypothetical protein
MDRTWTNVPNPRAATIPQPLGSAHRSGRGFGFRLKQASTRLFGRPSSTSVGLAPPIRDGRAVAT